MGRLPLGSGSAWDPNFRLTGTERRQKAPLRNGETAIQRYRRLLKKRGLVKRHYQADYRRRMWKGKEAHKELAAAVKKSFKSPLYPGKHVAFVVHNSKKRGAATSTQHNGTVISLQECNSVGRYKYSLDPVARTSHLIEIESNGRRYVVFSEHVTPIDTR